MFSTFFYDMAAQLANAGTVEEIHRLCWVITRKLGYDYFIYGAKIATSFVEPKISIISGYPTEWRQRYHERRYLEIDPIVAFCSSNLLPVTWDRFQVQECDEAVAEFLRESQEFGLRSGVSIPIHDAQGRRALLSLVSRRDHEDMRRHIAVTLPFAHAISFHIHEAARRVLDADVVFPRQLQLTNREIECLRWAAEGKTSWETSQILGVSERTVTFHMRNASVKLQVSNRSHAVARAVSLGVVF